MRTLRTITESGTATWISLKMCAVVAVLIAGIGLTACHTVEGAGRDVQAIGGGVEDTADRTRPYE